MNVDSFTCKTQSLVAVPLNSRTPNLGYGLLPNKRMEKDLCKDIIKNAERCSEFRGGWRTKRHQNFATTDLCVYSDFPSYFSLHIIKDLLWIYPVLKKCYSIPSELDFTMSDLFVVRFATGAQNALDLHLDGSLFSFVLSLSEEDSYEMGGTLFPDISPNVNAYSEEGHQGQSFKLGCGEIIIFAGGMIPHGSVPVTKGVRYILAGFINFSHAQRGLDVHIQHKSKILTAEASRLGNELKELAKSFSINKDNFNSEARKPTYSHRQLYDTYLSSLQEVGSRWNELSSI